MAHSSRGFGGFPAERIVVAFLALLFVGAWLGFGALSSPAQAQIEAFDDTAQRKLLLDEVRRTNRLLGEVLEVLRSGVLNVRVQGTDKKPTGADRERPSG